MLQILILFNITLQKSQFFPKQKLYIIEEYIKLSIETIINSNNERIERYEAEKDSYEAIEDASERRMKEIRAQIRKFFSECGTTNVNSLNAMQRKNLNILTGLLYASKMTYIDAGNRFYGLCHSIFSLNLENGRWQCQQSLFK